MVATPESPHETREQLFLLSVKAPTQGPSKERGPRPNNRPRQNVLGEGDCVLPGACFCASVCLLALLSGSGVVWAVFVQFLSRLWPCRLLISWCVFFFLWAPSRRPVTTLQVSPVVNGSLLSKVAKVLLSWGSGPARRVSQRRTGYQRQSNVFAGSVDESGLEQAS